MRKKIFVGGAVLILLVSGVMGLRHYMEEKNTEDTPKEHYEYYYNEEGKEQSEDGTVVSSEDLEDDNAPLIEVDTDPESMTVLVNQEYLLPEEYIPSDLVKPNISFSFYGTYEKSYMRETAAKALEELFSAAQEAGYTLKGVSAYRSYARQKQIYDRNVATKGQKKADKISAKPGSSEHQTGLTIDVSCSSIGCALEESFGDTAEGQWLAKHCHKYGYIIRYPKDKSDITGYSYEPWHIRYVGKNLAKYLHKNNLTLEEYYQTTTEDNKVAPDEMIQDTDVDAPEETQVSSAPTANPSYQPKKSPTPSPEKTKKPKVTKKPKKPKKTNKPTATPKKKATAKPKETAKPTNTPKATPQEEKPKITAEPTEAPVVTEEPQEVEQNGEE